MMRTLIIDDEEYVRLVLEQALREEGCEVTAVTHGAAGIEALQATTFECVITDLRMPGLDGRAVLKWVREHQPDVDVLMLTGHGDVKDAVEAITADAEIVRDSFPSPELNAKMGEQRFDIITSIAMFYDLEDPVAFVPGAYFVRLANPLLAEIGRSQI